jgi:hypothetical protein
MGCNQRRQREHNRDRSKRVHDKKLHLRADLVAEARRSDLSDRAKHLFIAAKGQK